MEGKFASFHPIGEVRVNERVAETRTKVMEKVRFRELSVLDARNALIASYGEVFKKVSDSYDTYRDQFFIDLAGARKHKAIPDTSPVPEKCRGPERGSAVGCSDFIFGIPRYMPYRPK